MRRREFLAGAAALAFAPDALASALGGTPTALVTADLESHVVAVEITTARRLREIETLAGPRSIERVGNVAVVGHTEEGAVSIIDGATLRVRRVIGGFTEPRYAVALPDERHALVSDSGTGELFVLDAQRGRIVGRASLGGQARHLSFDARSRRATVALGNKAERVAIVDLRSPTRPRLIRRFAPPFLAHDVGVFADGRTWVTSGAARELALYRRGRLVARFAGDAPPQHVTFAAGRAFVTSGDDGLLRVYSAATGRLIATSRIPTGSYNVQHAWGGRVLMPSLSRGTLCIADARGRVLRQVDVAQSSHDACFVLSA
jgi:outer membrane protein assembly factor BamB